MKIAWEGTARERDGDPASTAGADRGWCGKIRVDWASKNGQERCLHVYSPSAGSGGSAAVSTAGTPAGGRRRQRVAGPAGVAGRQVTNTRPEAG